MAAKIDRWVLALVLVAACKTSRKAEAPSLHGDDLVDVERALALSDTDLRDAGIVVAYRGPTNRDVPQAEVGGPPPTTAPTQEDQPAPTPEPTPAPNEPISDEPTTITEAEELDAPTATHLPARERQRSPLAEWIAGRKAAKAARTRCERVCDLAAATCDLRDRICDLAGDHPDDARYTDACTRAEDQCSAAKSYCDGCAA